MPFFNRIHHLVFPAKETEPAHAYDLWSLQYDAQPDNLMLELDKRIVNERLSGMNLKNKTVIDIGCGTGRHWPKILDQQPARLVGYDVSEGMLKILKEKFPGAETHRIHDYRLAVAADQSCDVIISTLTIAHIENIEEAMSEWDRVLKPGGEILITDYHPEALAKGGKRTFLHKGKTVAVRNHIHFIETIQAIAGQLDWRVNRFTEIKIDEGMKPWYEKQNALEVFEKFKHIPIIYGLHLIKSHAGS